MLLESKAVTKQKKIWIVISGLIIVVLIFIAVKILMIRNDKKDVSFELQFVKVAEHSFNNTKLISGQVKPGKIESFYVDSTKGKVKNIEVKEGQEVEKGEKLFTYDNEEINLQMKQSELDQKMADMRYEQGKKKIDLLKQEIKKAKDSGAGKEVIDPMDGQVNELEMQQKTTNLEREKGKLQKEELQRKQQNLIVYSSFSGVVQKLDKDAVQSSSQVLGGQGKSFLQIASKDRFEVEGTLTEIQKSQIQKDQTFIVTAKANSKKKWTGKITEVSEFPTSAEMAQTVGTGEGTQNNMSQYMYKASLDGQDGLSPGYHVSLQVNLENRLMIVVPSKSIVEKDNDTFIYIEEKGKIRKQNVKKGVTDGDWIEIVEGVSLGQKVLKNPFDDVYDGMEVKEK